MKNMSKSLLFLGILACLFPGCRSEPDPKEVEVTVEIEREVPKFFPLHPVTMDLIRTLKDVREFQYYISNQVVLEAEKTSLDTIFKEIVTVGAETKGVIIAPPEMNAGKVMLKASFEPNNDNLFLWFAQSGDGFFELDIQMGMTHYGDQPCRIIYSGARKPRLLIDLSSGKNVEANVNTRVDINTRTVEGRSID